MLEKYLPAFGIVGLALLVGGYFLIAPKEEARKDALTFSHTAMWEPDLLALSEEPTRYPAETFVALSLSPPPKNSSREVAGEIAALLSYQKLRTPHEIEDILAERDLTTASFGGHTIATYMDEKKFPATALLLKDSFHDLTVITLQEKRKFDRVRPSVLNPVLDTVIAVPGHPAYPSGHSTQIHFLAYVFGELAPERRNEFLIRADQVAKNREIAGLHYPSDSRAGVLLAQQFFALILENPKFQKLLAAAKEEWR